MKGAGPDNRPVRAQTGAGRHDTAARRRAQRRGRERGCWVYLAAEQLREAGVDPYGPPPFYRVWAAPDRPRFVVNLYMEA